MILILSLLSYMSYVPRHKNCQTSSLEVPNVKKFFSAALLFVALFTSYPAFAQSEPLKVVASFSILADMAKNVGGKFVEVSTLVGPDGDIHTYQPTPEDAKKIVNADVVIINGLGLEGWLERLMVATKTRARVVIATAGLNPRVMYSVKGVPDPHAWQNIPNGRVYIRNIANAFEQILPSDAPRIEAQAKAYDTILQSTEQFVINSFKSIPQSQRKIITSHDAFGYFGAAYRIEVLAPVGVNTEAEASANDVSKLMTQMKNEGVKVVFFENMENKQLIQQIAHDTGAAIGGTLYSDALSPAGGPATTYVTMFRHNSLSMKSAMLQNRPPK